MTTEPPAVRISVASTSRCEPTAGAQDKSRDELRATNGVMLRHDSSCVALALWQMKGVRPI
ncbi:hypothetical protein PLANPX_0798 [Lacipirellula parvula]|uniref:Uncharacterized protein n=1 Tax=Lacipirellula parvula TaxID=2650471 RepID=A0A5K7XA30_9BACT|nr:hypothetical protein PLANPX_0798 [Lacipirellula parvula]